MELYTIILLAVLFEALTVIFRLALQLQSKQWQQSVGMPRIHHGYIGIIFLFASYGVYATPEVGIAFWVVGWALIISDLVHHYTVLPLLRITETDLKMQFYGLTPKSLRRVLLIAIGGTIVIAILSSVANSLWFAAISFAMIYVSEELHTLLPKFKVSPRVAKYF